jgi:hypothetical protein
MAEVKDPISGAVEPSSRDIRASIRRTRAQMDDTVDAIEARLTPGELVYEAWTLFRGGSSSSVNRIWRIAKQYPMPASIITVGLGWMAYETARGSDERAAGRYGARYADEPSAVESARHGVSSAARRTTDAASAAIDTTGELAAQARDAARTRLWKTLEEQPLIVGAAALAAGTLVGLLLPSTRAEDELMGEARDSLINEVRGLGEQVLEKGKHVATAAADKVTEGAEAQGLSAEAVAEKVRNVGRDVAETVRGEAQKLAREARAPEPQEGQIPPPPRHRAA